ncbi:MAG: hypothetical protein A3G81_30615 [Betaproteobacteria bacterium RIFCSPLOWO2_12_FULL_65_14]|nr:MAG: hypothetical protein A3G81_30615 [Betaproteobacteria bacterium RIFCSPLOWO2_12_FULL_65_14]
MNAALVLFAVIVLIAGLALLKARRTARADDALLLPEMMRLRGTMPPEPLTKAAVHDAALAERRCLACGAKAMCSELIAAGRSDGYALFCPNAHYIEQVRSRLL